MSGKMRTGYVKEFRLITRPSKATQTGFTPYQQYQVDKNFLATMINGLNSTITNISRSIFSPEAQRVSPELKNLRRAKTELQQYMKKRKLTEEDKEIILRYADVQAILEGKLWQPEKKKKEEDTGWISPDKVKATIK